MLFPTPTVMQLIKIITAILLTASTSVITAQERISKRKEYKEFKSLTYKHRCDSIGVALELQQWVVEGEKVPGRRGATIKIEPDSYFIALNRNELIISTGNTKNPKDTGFYKAMVESYEVANDSKSEISTIQITADNQGAKINITIEIRPCGDMAWVDISGKRLRRQIIIGHIMPINFSAVYSRLTP